MWAVHAAGSGLSIGEGGAAGGAGRPLHTGCICLSPSEGKSLWGDVCPELTNHAQPPPGLPREVGRGHPMGE